MKNMLLFAVVIVFLSACKFEGHRLGSNVKTFVLTGDDLALYHRVNVHDTIPICQMRHISDGEKNWEMNCGSYNVGDTVKDTQMPWNIKLWYVVDSVGLFVVE